LELGQVSITFVLNFFDEFVIIILSLFNFFFGVLEHVDQVFNGVSSSKLELDGIK